MATQITATEANQRFSEMLRRVQQGESFVVTSRGHPVARLEAANDSHVDDPEERRKSMEELIAFMRRQPVRVFDWKREDLYD